MRLPTPHNMGEEEEGVEEVESEEIEEVENEQEVESEVTEEVENEQEIESEVIEEVESEEEEEQATPEAMSTPARHRERGAGSYSVDESGRIVVEVNASQSTCSLRHLPTKTPSLTIKYATGEDKAAFASLAARVLQFSAAEGDYTSTINQLPGMVSHLLDASAPFLPPHPCPAPESLEPAGLASWDCSGPLLHIHRLLQVACRITIMAHYHLGGFLRQVLANTNATNSKQQSKVLAALANAAREDSDRRYNTILSSCGCEECTHALRRPGQLLCRASQVLGKFARDSLANITPTFFCQCVQMYAALPSTHTLFTQCVESVTVTPTHARLLAAGIHQAICHVRRQVVPLPRPHSQLGLWHHFEVAARPEEAIDLVDGDGGYLVVDHIPGLRDFVHTRVPATIWREGMRGDLVAFRCHGHDALEIGHLYHCPDGTHHHLGYEALCTARRLVGKAQTATIHTAGEVDVHGRRLICTIAITTSSHQGTSTSIGECLLRAGLSYPMPDASADFTGAFAEAQASSSGVFAILPHSLAASNQLCPSQLRAALGPSSRSAVFLHNGETYKVTGKSALRHASHVMLWVSREVDAGQGAFVRSRPPHLPANVRLFIKKGDIICGYCQDSISDEELLQLSHVELEYSLSITFRGTFHYCAYVYDGYNIGRYVNQGGLQPALEKLLRLARLPGRVEFATIEELAQTHCNCKFAKRQGFGAVLVADYDIRLRDSPTELLANYGIEKYWLGFFARHCVELGFQNRMVRIVLWCATSPHSHLQDDVCEEIMRAIPPGVQIPADITPR